MAPSYYCRISPVMAILLFFLLVTSFVFPVHSYDSNQANRTLPPSDEMPSKLDMIRAHLQKINKPSTKTIQSPDGDLIDCVPSHLQPAFDHPLLKGKKPMDPPERPKGVNPNEMVPEKYQLWSLSGESCPEGTIPIRRTTEEDVLRASSIETFGRKFPIPQFPSPYPAHEHSTGTVIGDQYYGAEATINVWAPEVVNEGEFSLAQMWVTAGSYANNDLNTIEAGWQVLYGDSNPRIFVYWTRSAYQGTGCYNLVCPGFVQTNNRIAVGAAIASRSSYEGDQVEISLLVQKDPNNGNWWLTVGSDVLGYWPSELFTLLRDHATQVQFGGEVVNTGPPHTSTQMGSGHFSGEGYGKTAYFRNLQVVGQDNSLVPVQGLQFLAEQPNCYDIGGGSNQEWGQYFYYGGPGRNENCP